MTGLCCVRDGVVLDVAVRRVELRARLRAMVKISGVDHGLDVAAWRAWWEESLAAEGEKGSREREERLTQRRQARKEGSGSRRR